MKRRSRPLTGLTAPKTIFKYDSSSSEEDNSQKSNQQPSPVLISESPNTCYISFEAKAIGVYLKAEQFLLAVSQISDYLKGNIFQKKIHTTASGPLSSIFRSIRLILHIIDWMTSLSTSFNFRCTLPINFRSFLASHP